MNGSNNRNKLGKRNKTMTSDINAPLPKTLPNSETTDMLDTAYSVKPAAARIKAGGIMDPATV